MFALPLVGWGMLSAAGYPIVPHGPPHLLPVLPQGMRSMRCGGRLIRVWPSCALPRSSRIWAQR
jgi:hypothetical protein